MLCTDTALLDNLPVMFQSSFEVSGREYSIVGMIFFDENTIGEIFALDRMFGIHGFDTVERYLVTHRNLSRGMIEKQSTPTIAIG